uniref:Uncharacterized protein n=1 Tax=Oryza punctata TaxID=4537 RepID=A0A0E0M8U0_ORYPU
MEYKVCAFIGWRQNVELMPNKLKDDVLVDNRIKPPLLICGKRDKGKGGAESWARCCTGAHTHFGLITLLSCCFAFHQWRPGGTDMSRAGCRCWRKPRQEDGR